MTGTSLDTVYDILSGKDVFSCVKKDIDLSGSGYVSNLDIRNFSSDGRFSPGMYILAFANKADVMGFQKSVNPLLFTVMNSHITMKVDSSGKMMFLVTDMTSGKPLANQEITVMRNISRSYRETWNAATNQIDRQYIPLSTQAFATGIILGKTNDQGFLDVSTVTLTG